MLKNVQHRRPLANCRKVCKQHYTKPWHSTSNFKQNPKKLLSFRSSDSPVHNSLTSFQTRKSVVMCLSIVFDIDGYKDFLNASFFLTYSCTYCVLKDYNVYQADTMKLSAALACTDVTCQEIPEICRRKQGCSADWPNTAGCRGQNHFYDHCPIYCGLGCQQSFKNREESHCCLSQRIVMPPAMCFSLSQVLLLSVTFKQTSSH